MIALLFAMLFVIAPALLLWLTHTRSWAQKTGIIVLCYLAGLTLGNSGMIPAEAAAVQDQLTDLSIAMAMPLLLFTLDVRQWRHVAGKALLSMLCATTAVVGVASALFFLLRDSNSESAAHFSAMAVGVYTGGTPNLAAIKAGLDIPDSRYLLFHSLDTLVGSLYLLLMLTLGIRLFRRLLPARQTGTAGAVTPGSTEHFDSDDYRPLLSPANLPGAIKPVALAALVVLLSLGISRLLAHSLGTGQSAAMMIVTLTTLGIALSLLSQVRAWVLSYKLGMYLIYVFCFVVASKASFAQLAQVDMTIIAFLFGTVAGSLVLHALLCRLTGIDSDTFMVTSIAAVCSPPFVPMMARALGNPATILSGMTTGIIGYALGNYLGISLGLFLQSL
ncbi:MAG: DUF819 family protein [Gammaproteobacteria bacterium]|jgi:uncharacterized membrane protein|nr:DUF819 family protein [Gammaproteobacteria bacterium]